MGSPTYGRAGSMPKASFVRGPLALDEDFLAGSQLSDFQRQVTAKLLSIVKTLPPESVTTRAAIGAPPKAIVFINFAPRQKEAAEMTIEIEQRTYVHIGVGEGTTYSLPHDVWDPRARDVLKFTEQIVNAVIGGKFQETIHYRAGTPVRWISKLRVEESPVSQDRTELLANLRGVFRKRAKRDVIYAPYT